MKIPAGGTPVGRLQDGTVYYGRLGELAYDGDDRVQCHLCGGWFKLVGGSHLTATHGWTLDTYREAFHLPEKAATCSHDLSERSRRRAQVELASHRAAGFGTPPPKASSYRPARWRSLVAKRPDLAAELHPSRNGGLDSSAIAPTSKRKIWWRCKHCEHEWQAAIANRVLLGAGCPGCGLKRRAETQSHVPPERSIALRYPQLARELHPTRNANLDPRVLGAASGRPVWWKCPTCSHEWQAPPASRTSARPSGCPSCWQRRRGALQQIVTFERSLAAQHPGLAAELHPTRNDGVDPTRLGARSGQKLWWRCGDCGHEWKTAVSTRSAGSGCPQCARERPRTAGPRPVSPQRSLAVLHPGLAVELHPARNANLDPATLAAHSTHKAWWKCASCAHEWQATISNRTQGSGCPVCARSRGARKRPALRSRAARPLHEVQ